MTAHTEKLEHGNKVGGTYGMYRRCITGHDIGHEISELNYDDMFVDKLRDLSFANQSWNDDDMWATLAIGMAIGEYLTKNPTHVVVEFEVNSASATFWFAGEDEEAALAPVRLLMVKEA